MVSSPLEIAVEVLDSRLAGRVAREAPLGARTTYRVGGRASAYLEVNSCDDLRVVHTALVEARGPVSVLVIGQGSNLLVSDAGFEGLAIGLGTDFDWFEVTGSTVRAGGATKLPVLARRTASSGLTGLEWAVGVPGSVGGALRMNAGGHGSDTSDVLLRYKTFDLSRGHSSENGARALRLGYRTSALRPQEVVLWAEYGLRPGDAASSQDAISEVVRWRRENQPGGSNAGSVFVNPPGDSAGRLVDASGLRGFRMATAAVSEKHANFVQADVGGSADDVRRLIDHVRNVVAISNGVELAVEVRMVGFEDSESLEIDAASTSTRGRGSES